MQNLLLLYQLASYLPKYTQLSFTLLKSLVHGTTYHWVHEPSASLQLNTGILCLLLCIRQLQSLYTFRLHPDNYFQLAYPTPYSVINNGLLFYLYSLWH